MADVSRCDRRCHQLMRRGGTVELYLEELDRLLAGPRRQRRRLLREIEDHIADAVAGLDAVPAEVAVPRVLDKLGSPLEIAAAAAGLPDLSGGLDPDAGPPGRIEGRVRCNNDVHVLRWKHGALVAVDHDQGAELALASLGGEAPFCLEVLRAWRQPYDGATLSLVPHWLDRDAFPPDLQVEAKAAWSGAWRILQQLLPSAAEPDVHLTRWRRAVIASLPFPLRSRFCAGVLRSAERRAVTDPEARLALSAVTSQLVRTVARDATAGPVPAEVTVEMRSDPVVRTTDGRLALTLPMTWARVVASSRAPTFRGRLVLDWSHDSLLILDWHRGRRGEVAVAKPVATAGGRGGAASLRPRTRH